MKEILKTFSKSLIQLGVIILAFIILFQIVKPFINKSLKYFDNVETLMNDTLQDKNLMLTKSDFKQHMKNQNDSLFMLLKDSLDLRYKNIERVITYNYFNTYDTAITKLIIKNEQPGSFYFDYVFPDSCLILAGQVHLKDSTIQFDKVTQDIKGKLIYFWKRKKLLGFLRIGRKQFHAVSENKCFGIDETYTIEILKEK